MDDFSQHALWRTIPDKMTPEEALTALMALEPFGDLEVARSQADDILCALLRFHGHDDAAAAFVKLDKWHS